MSFSISVDQVPSIRDYAHAVAFEGSITPIKGNGVNAGIKPIGKRSAAHLSVRKIEAYSAAKGTGIAFRLHSTDCVMFWMDGSIDICTDGWETVSTRKFINEIIHWHERTLTVGSMSGVGPIITTGVSANSPRQVYKRGSTMTLGPDRSPIDPEPCVVHRVNRRAMNEVRRLNAPFLAYAIPLIKIAYPADGVMSLAEHSEAVERAYLRELAVETYPSRDTAEIMVSIMRGDNIQDWADLLEAIACIAGATLRWPSPREFRYRPDRMISVIDSILKYGYSDAVFTEVTLPLGTVAANPNIQYIYIERN